MPDLTPNLSRRQMLLASAAAAGATWFDVPRLLADTRDQSRRKYGGFQMGIQTFSLRGWGAEQYLDQVAALELHWIEPFRIHLPPVPNMDRLRPALDRMRSLDISISAHGVNTFTDDHAANKVFFEFAKMAGIPQLSAMPRPDSFDSLERLVDEYDIRIAIHNHGPTDKFYPTTKEALAAVKGRDQRIGFCADLGHYIRSGLDAVKVIHELGERLYGVHLKDFAEAKAKTEGVILGKGLLDVDGVFKALKEVKFRADGALSLEYEEKPNEHEQLMAELRENLAIAAASAQKAAGYKI